MRFHLFFVFLTLGKNLRGNQHSFLRFLVSLSYLPGRIVIKARCHWKVVRFPYSSSSFYNYIINLLNVIS